MIPRIKKILYTTDLTKNSAYAFRYAVNSAQKHNAQIYLLHVIEKLSPAVEGLLGLHMEQSQIKQLWLGKKEEQIKRIHERLKEFAKRELQSDPETMGRVADIIVVEGDPASEILKKADELGCDIVVMGTHSHGIITHTFLGSVAEKVLHRIRKPVYIIPIPEEDTDITFRDI
ncbi:MAG: universal stress protein [Deltaproteobacteria bacterium]|nr:universal stress protein [Deltaproteobacteria bacterium]